MLDLLVTAVQLLGVKPKTIGANFLKAILDVLENNAPDLRHHIVTLTKAPPVTGAVQNRGESIYHQYAVQMRKEDAIAILSALEAAQSRFGYDAAFAGLQLGLLISVWAGVVESLQVQPDN
jgi:hypothetical protein